MVRGERRGEGSALHQVVAHLVRIEQEEAAGRPLAMQKDRPVGEALVVAHDVGEVRVLLAPHVGQHDLDAVKGAGGSHGRGSHGGGGDRVGQHRELGAGLRVDGAHAREVVRPRDVLVVPDDDELDGLTADRAALEGREELRPSAARGVVAR